MFYLFIWLQQVLVAAPGSFAAAHESSHEIFVTSPGELLHGWRGSSHGIFVTSCGNFFAVLGDLPWCPRGFFLVVARGLVAQWHLVRGILVPQPGTELMSHALESRFLTTGLPEKARIGLLLIMHVLKTMNPDTGDQRDTQKHVTVVDNLAKVPTVQKLRFVCHFVLTEAGKKFILGLLFPPEILSPYPLSLSVLQHLLWQTVSYLLSDKVGWMARTPLALLLTVKIGTPSYSPLRRCWYRFISYSYVGSTFWEAVASSKARMSISEL